MVLSLINRKQIKPNDFEERPGGSVQISDSARKVLLPAWQQRKQDEVKHVVLGQSVQIGLIPMVQARL